MTVMMKGDHDFGFYTCKAENGFGAAVSRTLQLQQIKSKYSFQIPKLVFKIASLSIYRKPNKQPTNILNLAS